MHTGGSLHRAGCRHSGGTATLRAAGGTPRHTAVLRDELVALASATLSLAEPGNSTDPPEPSQQLCTKAEKLPKCENLCPSGAGHKSNKAKAEETRTVSNCHSHTSLQVFFPLTLAVFSSLLTALCRRSGHISATLCPWLAGHR